MSAEDPRFLPPPLPASFETSSSRRPPDSEPAEVDDGVEELPKLRSRLRRNQRLALIGAGHAHLQILEWWREKPIRNVDLTLYSAFPVAVYSGMVPSVLAGLVPKEEMEVDLARLTQRCGAELVIDKVVGMDLETHTLDLAIHAERNFDVASINIGSTNAREELCRSHRVIVAVKPLPTFLSRFEARMQELLQQFRDAPGSELLQLAVVGGGAGGVELALCLQARSRREGWHAAVRLIDSRAEILPGYADRTIRLVRQLLRKRSIGLQLNATVTDCDEDGPAELMLANGDRLRVDLAIWAADAAPPGLLRGYPLPKAQSGFLAVRPTLQTTVDLPVFAAGGVAEIVASLCPKARVSAVRQAPVLWENLRRWFRGEPLTQYEPQTTSLSLLSCGDKTAVLDYRGFSLRSSWMWRLKQHLDRKFVQRFR